MNNEINVISVFLKPSKKVIYQHLVEPEVKYESICNISYFKRLPFLFKMM